MNAISKIEFAAAEMILSGWGGVEVRGSPGSFHGKTPDGDIYCEPPRPIKEWIVTFFYIIRPGRTTVKAIGKGKTLTEAITKAKEAALDRVKRENGL